MPPLIATFVYAAGICGLFFLERSGERKVSKVLWLPVVSLLIGGSRPIATWLGMQSGNSPEALIEGNPIDAAIALGLVIAGSVVLFRRPGAVVKALRMNAAVIPFLMYCAVSISWSDYPEVAFKRWIRLICNFVTILLVLTDTDPSRAMKWVLTRVGFLLIPISVLLIKYYPTLSQSYDPWTGQRFVSGVATDKNMLGMTCLVFGLAILFQFLCVWREGKSRKRLQQLIAYGAVLAMTLWLFSVADSMTSLSCFYMGSLVLVVMSFPRFARKRAAAHILTAVIVGVSFGVLFLHIGESAALQHLGRNSTLTGRTEIWTGLLAFSGNPLFGVGFESFWLGDRLTKIWAAGGLLAGINEAHNGYLETYLNLGSIGVILLSVLIVVGYRNIIRALPADPETVRLRLAFFVVAMVYNFTEAGFRNGSCIWVAFFFAIWHVPSPGIRKKSRPINAGTSQSSDSEAESWVELQTTG